MPAFTMFGKTKIVPFNIMINGYKADGEDYEETLWVDRDEDMYALLSPKYRDKRVLVVRLQDWMRSKEVGDVL